MDDRHEGNVHETVPVWERVCQQLAGASQAEVLREPDPGDEITLTQLQRATGVARHVWRCYLVRLGDGVTVRRHAGQDATVLSISALHQVLRIAPELWDYARAGERLKRRLRLADLPQAPRWKEVCCPRCSNEGMPAYFWAHTYGLANCPSCRRRVSRLSVRGRYTDSCPTGE